MFSSKSLYEYGAVRGCEEKKRKENVMFFITFNLYLWDGGRDLISSSVPWPEADAVWATIMRQSLRFPAVVA